MVIGKPIMYNHENNTKEEQDRICNYLMDEISEIAFFIRSFNKGFYKLESLFALLSGGI